MEAYRNRPRHHRSTKVAKSATSRPAAIEYQKPAPENPKSVPFAGIELRSRGRRAPRGKVIRKPPLSGQRFRNLSEQNLVQKHDRSERAPDATGLKLQDPNQFAMGEDTALNLPRTTSINFHSIARSQSRDTVHIKFENIDLGGVPLKNISDNFNKLSTGLEFEKREVVTTRMYERRCIGLSNEISAISPVAEPEVRNETGYAAFVTQLETDNTAVLWSHLNHDFSLILYAAKSRWDFLEQGFPELGPSSLRLAVRGPLQRSMLLSSTSPGGASTHKIKDIGLSDSKAIVVTTEQDEPLDASIETRLKRTPDPSLESTGHLQHVSVILLTEACLLRSPKASLECLRCVQETGQTHEHWRIILTLDAAQVVKEKLSAVCDSVMPM